MQISTRADPADPNRSATVRDSRAPLLAGRRIWGRADACAPAQVCAVPSVRRGYKMLFGAAAVLVLIALAFPYLAPLFY